MSDNRIPNLLLKGIDGSAITWRHMEDNPNDGLYHRSGVRYFAIKLTDEMAAELEEQGWPVIWSDVNKNNDKPEELQPYLKVFIKYGTRFPVDIYLVNANLKQKTLLEENDLDQLHIDAKPIVSVDVLLRAYYWTYGNEHGVKAQVQAMNILLAQDGLDDDYEIVYQHD